MRISTLALLAACSALPAIASAQYNSTSAAFGTQSGTSVGNSGGTSTYGTFGNRTLGGGTTGNSGSSGSSGNAGGAPTMDSAMSGAGQVTGNERFLRENRQGAFVGADNGDTSNIMSQSQGQQQNALQGLQQFSQQLARAQQQAQRNSNQNQGPGKKPLRIKITADIPITNAQTSTMVSQQFENRLKKIPAMAKAGSVQVTMEGRTAILQGRVATARDRELAQGLAMLEPGISRVQNELIVDASAARAEELPRPRTANPANSTRGR